jgi:hypothetical protein
VLSQEEVLTIPIPGPEGHGLPQMGKGPRYSATKRIQKSQCLVMGSTPLSQNHGQSSWDPRMGPRGLSFPSALPGPSGSKALHTPESSSASIQLGLNGDKGKA